MCPASWENIHVYTSLSSIDRDTKKCHAKNKCLVRSVVSVSASDLRLTTSLGTPRWQLHWCPLKSVWLASSGGKWQIVDLSSNFPAASVIYKAAWAYQGPDSYHIRGSKTAHSSRMASSWLLPSPSHCDLLSGDDKSLLKSHDSHGHCALATRRLEENKKHQECCLWRHKAKPKNDWSVRFDVLM